MMLKNCGIPNEPHGCGESQCRVGNASLVVRQEPAILKAPRERHHFRLKPGFSGRRRLSALSRALAMKWHKNSEIAAHETFTTLTYSKRVRVQQYPQPQT